MKVFRSPLTDRLRQSTLSIAKAYGAVLFLQSPIAGLVILVLTLFYPNIGLAGLLAAVIACLMSRLFRFAEQAEPLLIFNSMLVGLSLGAFYQLNIYLLAAIILGAILCSLVAIVLADWLWRLDRLPAMSLPFVIVAGVMSLVARHYTNNTDYMGLAQSASLLSSWFDGFFSSLGAVYFTPVPHIGLVLFLLLLIYSRYLGLLAVTGYLVGYGLLKYFLFEPHPSFLVWTGFNFILTSIALGGIFTIPGLYSLLLAVAGVLLSALLVIVTQNWLLVEGLPVMAVSFVVTTLILLAALKKRSQLRKPYLAPEPALPEVNFEKARLARYRNGDVNSVPLLAPFYGVWTIYQGFNGRHTHKPPWQYALDFIITSDGRSYNNNGQEAKDYFCFGAPVLSPAYGEVVRTYDRLPDNTPGEVDTRHNWGNFVLLRLVNGLHVLLAHLQQGSIKVKEGDMVPPGKTLAACGNSGRSPQPHLHMQVQQDAQLGSATYPFHLGSMLLHRLDEAPEYKVVLQAQEGDHIEPATADEQLQSHIHLPVGHQLVYQWDGAAGNRKKSTFTVELSLSGQFRLCSDSGASAAFAEDNGVIAFYDRNSVKDRVLDIWLLANGLTPLSERAHSWQDSPPAKLLPLNLWEKLVLALRHPLGCGLHSHYQRQWDQQQGVWRQQASHELVLGVKKLKASTEAIIDPRLGYKSIEMSYKGETRSYSLVETGLVADQGIPAWKLNTAEESPYDTASGKT